MQKKRIVAVVSIVLIVNFFLILIRWSDTPLDFIPFLDIFLERRLRIYAYDIFLAVTVLLYLLLYKKYGINLSVIKSIPSLFYPINRIDIGISIGTAIGSYFFICPFIFESLSDPILRLCKYTHDSIRHTVMMALIFSLLFILSILSKNSSTGAYYQSPPSQAPTMPPPPTW
jgi:hypothetical protein